MQINKAKKKLAAIDIGAETGRVIIGHMNENSLKLEELYRFPSLPSQSNKHLYTDVNRIWTNIQSGLQRTADMYKEQISSIGVDSWGVDFALLDSDSSLLGMPYHYRDSRTGTILQRAAEIISLDELYFRTGNQLMPFNSLFQLFATKLQEPEVLERASTLLMLPDLFHYWLCGHKSSEFSNATTTQCYDQINECWAAELLEKFEIPSNLFQSVSLPGTQIGEILPGLAKSLGIPSYNVILPATHDTSSAIIAVPASREDYLYISSGTWSLVGLELEKPLITDESLAVNITNEGLYGGMTSFLKIVPGMWMLQQCKSEWQALSKNYTYAELTELAMTTGRHGALVDVTDETFLLPGKMVLRIQDYCQASGQNIPTREGEIVRCIIESLSCLYRSLLNDFERILKKRLDVIHIVGGGSRNHLLNQMTADNCNRTVISGPEEATAAGNILIQAMGLGLLGKVSDIRQIIRNSFQPISWQPQHSDQWDERFSYYKGICIKMKKLENSNLTEQFGTKGKNTP